MADEEITIRAELEGALARDLHVAARAADALGDEAAESAAQVAALEAATKGMGEESSVAGKRARRAGDDVDEFGNASQRAASSHRAQSRGLDSLNKALGTYQKITRRVKGDGFWDLFSRDADKATASGNRANKMLKKMIGLLPRLALIGVIVTGLSFLVKALEGVGAAAYAATAGLSPLLGMAVAFPGAIGAMVQGIATLKIGTNGMGEMMKVMLDAESTAAEIRESQKGMAQEQIGFANAVKAQVPAWKNLRKLVGGNLFRGMGAEVRQLSATYMPLLNRHLGHTAIALNKAAKGGSEWLRSLEGVATMDSVMETNASLVWNMSRGMGELAKTTALLVRAGGPMLRRMGKDFQGWTAGLADKAAANQKPLERFFNKSYDLFKRSWRILGTYMSGLFNIGKQSGALSKYMGDNIERIGQQFEQWTKSSAGKRDIKKYFQDMIPIVEELGLWLRDISRLLGGSAMKNGDFVKTSKSLRTNLLPAVAKAVQWINDKMVPALLAILEVIGDLSEAGVIGGAWSVLKGFGSAIAWVADKLAGMPDPVKKLVGLASGIAAIAGVIGLIKGGKLGGMLGLMGKRVFVTNPVLAVRVVNFPIGFGTKGKPKGGPVSTRKPNTANTPKNTGPPKHRADGKPNVRPNRGAGNVPKHRGAPPSAASRAAGAAKGAGRAAGKFLGPAAAVYGLATASKQLGDTIGDINGWNKGALKAASSSGSFAKRYAAVSKELKDSAVGKHAQKLGIDTDRLARSMAASGTKGAYYQQVLSKAKKETSGFGGVMKSIVPFTKTQAWTDLAVDLGQAGRAMGATKGKAAGLSAATQGLWNKTKQYSLAIHQLPKRAVTTISSPGWAPTYRNISQLVTKYKLTPKMVRTLVKETGATLTKSQMEKVITKAKEVGRQKPKVKVDADTSAARSKMQRLIQDYSRKAITIIANIVKSGPLSFAGNPMKAGQSSWVGEIAPEAFISRSGKMDIIGKHGPEFRKFSTSGAVVPHTVLADPFHGDPGNAPAWAVKALQRKAAAGVPPAPQHAPPAPTGRAGPGGGGRDLADLPPIHVAVDARGSDVTPEQMKAAVKKAVAEALRQERERRINHGWRAND